MGSSISSIPGISAIMPYVNAPSCFYILVPALAQMFGPEASCCIITYLRDKLLSLIGTKCTYVPSRSAAISLTEKFVSPEFLLNKFNCKELIYPSKKCLKLYDSAYLAIQAAIALIVIPLIYSIIMTFICINYWCFKRKKTFQVKMPTNNQNLKSKSKSSLMQLVEMGSKPFLKIKKKKIKPNKADQIKDTSKKSSTSETSTITTTKTNITTVSSNNDGSTKLKSSQLMNTIFD